MDHADEPAYDFNCCMRSSLRAAMRLHEGEIFTLPAIAMQNSDPKTITYRVRARERIFAGYRGWV